MFWKKQGATSQTNTKVLEIIDQINHLVDLKGFEDHVYDEKTQKWMNNPHNAEIDRLTNELKDWYKKGNAEGINWNKLPKHYQIWLRGYLED